MKTIYYTIIFSGATSTRVDKFYHDEDPDIARDWAYQRAARLQSKGLDARVLKGKLQSKSLGSLLKVVYESDFSRILLGE